MKNIKENSDALTKLKTDLSETEKYPDQLKTNPNVEKEIPSKTPIEENLKQKSRASKEYPDNLKMNPDATKEIPAETSMHDHIKQNSQEST